MRMRILAVMGGFVLAVVAQMWAGIGLMTRTAGRRVRWLRQDLAYLLSPWLSPWQLARLSGIPPLAGGANEQLGVAGLTEENKQLYEKKMLMRAVPAFVHLGWGRAPVTVGRVGNSVQWRRLERPTRTTTAFLDATYPAETQVTIAAVAATIQQYGAWTPVGQLAWEHSIDPVVEEMVDMYGEHAGDSLDAIARAALIAGTNVQFAGVAASRSAVGSCADAFLDEAEIREAVRELTRRNAKRVAKAGNRFPAIVHPDAWFDFMGDTTIQNVLQNAAVRGNDNPVFTGEMFDYLGVRFMVSSNASVRGSIGQSLIVAIYSTIVLGEEAYGEARFGSYGQPEIIVNPPSDTGVGGPLKTRGTVGWKASLAVVRLNEAFIHRIEHSTSKNDQTDN